MRTRYYLHSRQCGFVLIWLLFFVAALGVGMAAMGIVWKTAAQRGNESELLFVGDQYRRAIESFWKATPGSEKHLPKSLDDLLLDPRFPNTVRHLRQRYRDPMTADGAWGLVKKEDGGILGVYSLSEAAPFKTGGFEKIYQTFEGATHYRDWIFQAKATDGGRTGADTEQTSDTITNGVTSPNAKVSVVPDEGAENR